MNTLKANPQVLGEVKEAINQIRYGEVIITIHGERVVQIEKREKKRFGQ